MSDAQRLRAIDSHTGGEPTRVVIDGFPDLGNGSMAERLEKFRGEYDHLRSAIVCEPRGHNAIVGAILREPVNKTAAAGVIFFNNVGYLGMCGHGTIGLITTLEYLGRIGPGVHKIETPVGDIAAQLHADGSVSITNVPSYLYKKDVAIDVPSFGKVVGDIAWGGNWFFLISEHGQTIDLANHAALTAFTVAVRNALSSSNITGENSGEIDHIELFSPSTIADSRNFVLCPGLEFDRSPCGTGTGAKLACLHADGKLKEGDIWRQESIVGSVFEGTVKIVDDKIIPIIRGTAHVTAELELILEEGDPFRFGIN
ncbi:MAG TPA: 4-hydroxyproline epimerase [Pyrinomonadaceae bacterium]|jgi:4-hydroxyproline epimerase|nr:4-hydroxyproline epimerase [Pyrinomonadaceae bacterium]